MLALEFKMYYNCHLYLNNYFNTILKNQFEIVKYRHRIVIGMKMGKRCKYKDFQIVDVNLIQKYCYIG